MLPTTKISIYTFLFILIQKFTAVISRTRCARVRGRLTCPTDPDRHFNIRLKLLDQDPLPWKTDDLMGIGFTDQFGNYTIEGCADDFGQWNDPDPYIFVEHRCPEPGHTISIAHRHKKISVERVFLPQEIHVPNMRLDVGCESY